MVQERRVKKICQWFIFLVLTFKQKQNKEQKNNFKNWSDITAKRVLTMHIAFPVQSLAPNLVHQTLPRVIPENRAKSKL